MLILTKYNLKTKLTTKSFAKSKRTLILHCKNEYALSNQKMWIGASLVATKKDYNVIAIEKHQVSFK